MPVRRSLLSLIPKDYYKISIERQIRCCGVLQTAPKRKENWFQSFRDEAEKFKAASNKGKTRLQYARESTERQIEGITQHPVVLKVLNTFRSRCPRGYELLVMVKSGIMNLFTDVRQMMKLNNDIHRGRSLYNLNLRELELHYEGWDYFKRLFPVLALGLLPFGNFIVLFLAYMRPLQFLSPHFWNEKQKAFMTNEQHAMRVAAFLPVIEHLKCKLHDCMDSPPRQNLQNVLKLVHNGKIPTSSDLIPCKQLFSVHGSLYFDESTDRHVDDLLALCGKKKLLFRIKAIENWITYLHLVDTQIEQQGMSQLSPDQLKKFCFQRGVNSNKMTKDEMSEWLNRWVKFSHQVPGQNGSLLLYAVALYGINHKSNRCVTISD